MVVKGPYKAYKNAFKEANMQLERGGGSMGTWSIRWNFNKANYSPGEQALVSFWMENTGENPLFLSNLQLEFDFGTYNLESISGMVLPRESKFLGNVWLSIPKNVVGRKVFTLKYHMFEYINGNWIDLGFYSSDKQYFVSVYPTPLYRVFLSRGLSTEDKAIGDPIAEMIREWGFDTVTVGIEVKVPKEQVPVRVKEEIKNSDAVIAIATPRFMDALTGLWRTLEWFHNEVGIAFGIDKPLLILKDRRVSLGGLPSYLLEQKQIPAIEFDPYNLNEVKTGLSSIMPGFREWIETKRGQEFFDSLGRIVIGGLAVVGLIATVSGITEALFGSSKK
ncbi:MAG: hypothetical protein QXP36_01760 [Conexivisphaerales archaeon]